MDQNTDNPNENNEPLFEQPPATPPEPASSESTFDRAEVPPADEEVIDVQAMPVTEELPPASSETYYANEPPLQPEILQEPTQSPPRKSNNGWIIALVVLIVLCCCCAILFLPMLFLGRIFVGILGAVYSAIIGILNSIFGGSVRFY